MLPLILCEQFFFSWTEPDTPWTIRKGAWSITWRNVTGSSATEDPKSRTVWTNRAKRASLLRSTVTSRCSTRPRCCNKWRHQIQRPATRKSNNSKREIRNENFPSFCPASDKKGNRPRYPKPGRLRPIPKTQTRETQICAEILGQLQRSIPTPTRPNQRQPILRDVIPRRRSVISSRQFGTWDWNWVRSVNLRSRSTRHRKPLERSLYSEKKVSPHLSSL